MLPIIHKEPPIMAVRTRLKEIREAKGYSRMDLVRQADISYPTVSKWEKETLEELDTTVLKKLCNFLDISIDELIVGIHEEINDD